MTVALIAAAVLAVACVVFVGLPFLREPGARDDALPAVGEAARRRAELVAERDRALAALKELEFDHRTGKVSEEDYRALVAPLRRTAAEALRALDDGGAPEAAAAPTGGTPSPQQLDSALKS